MTTRLSYPYLARQEDALNAALALSDILPGTVRRVCLHVDRTVIRSLGRSQSRTVQCDYCDSLVYDSGWGPVPVMAPYEYLERVPCTAI